MKLSDLKTVKGKRMNQWFRTVAVATLLVALTGCGGARYDDYRVLLREELTLMRTFNRDAAAAGDATALAAALGKLNDGLAGLGDRVKQFTAQHSELAALTAPPPELQSEFDDLGKALSELDHALLEKEKLLDSPEAGAELQRLMDLQAELGF
jgi:hypothetical protein